MSQKSPIPSSAISVKYQPLGKATVEYHVWPAKGKWYWAALGNNGTAGSMGEAMAAAREWIAGEAPTVLELARQFR